MTGWIIFLSILTIVLLLPIRCCFSYDEQVRLVVWLAFVPLKILPSETSGDQENSEEPKESEKEEHKKTNVFSELRKEKGLKGFLSFLKKLLQIVFRAVKRFGKHLIAERCEAEVTVGAEDSAAVAEQYGAVCAAAFPVWAQLLSLTRCRRHNLQIRPDFFAESYQIRCRIRIRIRLFWIIRAAAAAAGSFLWLMLKEKMHSVGPAGEQAAAKKCG